MALCKNIQKTIYGKELVFPNAYIEIVSLNGTKNKIRINVNTYDTKAKENLIKMEEYSFVPSVEDSSENFVKQGYEFLKTLLEFKGALDVLEEGQY